LARFWARSRIEPRHLTDPAIEGHADDLEWLAATASKTSDAAVGWRADAILVDGYESARVALIAKRFLVPDLPVIVRAGSCLRDSTTGANSVVDSAILADYLRDAEAIAATTTALAEEAIAAYPSLRDNTLVIPSPIDREAALAGPSEDSADSRWLGGGAPLFLCALGEDADAGLRWLLETVSVAADRAAFRVAVVECGRRTPGFEEHVAAMGISEERVGFLSDSASLPGNLLESAAGFMYLGCEPGPEVPRQIVRAVAAGCPVIVPRGSLLVDELFDEGRLGLQVRIASPRALAEAMLQLLWDGDAGADLARCASERLEAMSAENVAARVDALVSAQVARTHP
jgi:glycosyltransferase involved in cell wall biosynthesis